MKRSHDKSSGLLQSNGRRKAHQGLPLWYIGRIPYLLRAFSSFFKLMEAARCTNESLRRASRPSLTGWSNPVPCPHPCPAKVPSFGPLRKVKDPDNSIQRDLPKIEEVQATRHSTTLLLPPKEGHGSPGKMGQGSSYLLARGISSSSHEYQED